MRGYDEWKATEPDPTQGVVGCNECGEELSKCVCWDDPELDVEVAPEAITDEQVLDLLAELREKRGVIARVEGLLSSFEASVRMAGRVDDDAPWLEERKNVVALLRAALGSAT